MRPASLKQLSRNDADQGHVVGIDQQVECLLFTGIFPSVVLKKRDFSYRKRYPAPAAPMANSSGVPVRSKPPRRAKAGLVIAAIRGQSGELKRQAKLPARARVRRRDGIIRGMRVVTKPRLFLVT
jgi:hypothetical protein